MFCFPPGRRLLLLLTGSGTTSAQHGKIPLDLGSCTKMVQLQIKVEDCRQVMYIVYRFSQPLKGHCHALWQLYKKLEGVFASVEFQN